MELSEKIQKQIAAGFSVSDIKENLQAEGHDKAEIEKELSQHSAAVQSTGHVSTKAVLIGNRLQSFRKMHSFTIRFNFLKNFLLT